jgi:biopolymer transport protein ExbD
MARKRRKQESQAGELNLTAMIDVAFQLLNFFVMTAKPVDVFANFDVFRPQATPSQPSENQPDLLEVIVYNRGYTLQKKDVQLGELDRKLGKLAALSKNLTLTIKCTEDSTHAGLVNVLDVCAKYQITKISVFSM